MKNKSYMKNGNQTLVEEHVVLAHLLGLQQTHSVVCGRQKQDLRCGR